MARTGFIGASWRIVRRGACPRSLTAGDRTVFAEAGGRRSVVIKADVFTLDTDACASHIIFEEGGERRRSGTERRIDHGGET
jgi:hypothetical protein